ncbi:MAG: IS21 family transposase [Candidatus Hydrogenedentes bacterium]|nr:IS21 family transposase [Candidatus Hydrogenedentota bacterium]
MRKIQEVLRLKWEGKLSNRAIAESCGIGETTVREYLRRAVRAGLSWPLPEGMDEAGLEQLLFSAPLSEGTPKRPTPNWPEVHQELKGKGVTLFLLWQEYKQARPDGYQYSQFCEHYRRWSGTLDVWMRQTHKAGEKMFVDYAGQTMPVVWQATGEVRQAQIFVATLGASNYTYVEAAWTQSLPEWIMAHTRAFTYFQGCPALVVCDNLRSAVSKACLYEPDLNPTYHAMARHYGVAVMPARSGKPRDKAKVENGVLNVERQILAPLRHRTFFSLHELNQALWDLLEKYNERPFQKLEGSRRSLFESLDKPALKPLPLESYEYAEWKQATVNIDYHIDADGHYYSVPHALARQRVDVRMTIMAVEIFHNGKRIASHLRSHQKGRHTTIPGHMPERHQAHHGWTPERIFNWAHKYGDATAEIVERIIESRAHPQLGYRSCLGLLRLGEHFGAERLEAACVRALAIQSPSYQSVKSILEKGLDQRPLRNEECEAAVIEHHNIRGPQYFNSN